MWFALSVNEHDVELPKHAPLHWPNAESGGSDGPAGDAEMLCGVAVTVTVVPVGRSATYEHVDSPTLRQSSV